MMKRVGVLSDTHLTDCGESLPDKLLEEFKNVDLILHAGDWVDLCVLEQLEPLAEVIGVAGNMDPSPVRYKMPQSQRLEIEGFDVGLIHGWGPDHGIESRIRKKFNPLPKLIVYGHTHEAVFKKDPDVYLFNPGSATGRSYGHNNSFGILTFDKHIDAEIIRL